MSRQIERSNGQSRASRYPAAQAFGSSAGRAVPPPRKPAVAPSACRSARRHDESRLRSPATALGPAPAAAPLLSAPRGRRAMEAASPYRRGHIEVGGGNTGEHGEGPPRLLDTPPPRPATSGAWSGRAPVAAAGRGPATSQRLKH